MRGEELPQAFIAWVSVSATARIRSATGYPTVGYGSEAAEGRHAKCA